MVGEKLAEGKTKIIFDYGDGKVLVENKDSITAGDGAKKNLLEGKGAASCRTASNCFALLNANGIETHFVEKKSDREFIARKCRMIPLEAVARRIATGSFLKRHAEVGEGTRFDPLVMEFFFKDDARHDPHYSEEQVVSENIASEEEVEEMKETLGKVFGVLERAWAKQNVTLVDLKIEFGRTEDGRLVVADVIDNDSWRIWPVSER